MTTKLEKLPHSRVRLTITVPSEPIIKHYDLAVARVASSIEIKGFRKGHAPKNLVIQKAGNQAVLREMIDSVLSETYFEALKEHKDLVPVSQPTIDVKELTGLSETVLVPTAIVYTAEVDLMPDVEVGDYKKIKVKPKKAPEKIEAKEVDGTLAELKKMYGDEYMKVANFKDEAEARKSIEDNIKQQKIFQAKADTYDEIIETILKKAKIDVPETFVHNEIHRMEQQIEAQAKAYGMTFDDWLKQEKKTHEDIHKDWHDQAEKAAKVGMILGRIAELEGIDPTKNDASRLVLDKLYTYATGESSTN